MSEVLNTEKKMVSVLNQGNTDGNKPLEIVRPSKLAKEGITGIVAEGIYKGTRTNPFEEEKNDFRIEGEEKDFIINQAGSLTSQLGKVEEGTYVQIHYLGKVKANKGNAAGKMVHNFQVYIEAEEENLDA